MRRIVSFLTAPVPRCREADGGRPSTPIIRVLWIGLLLAPPVPAELPRQDLAEIEKVAEAFLQDAGGGTPRAQKMDPRLRLAPCDRPLQAFMRDGAQVRKRTVVGIRCPGSQPWKVYVPVNLRDEREVVVLRHAQPRGHVLAAADLELQQRDVTRLSAGYATRVSAVTGRRLKHSLQRGSVVTPAAIASKTLVRRGQSVTLRAQTDALQIRVAGKALMDGALGQRIRVQNTASGRVVEGLVRSAELVEILVQ